MKQTYRETPLHILQPAALFNFASQTFGFVTQSLGYREPASYTDDDEDYGRDIREKDEETGLDMYSLSEVAQHETFDDCWIVLYDKVSHVYNIFTNQWYFGVKIGSNNFLKSN